MKHYKQSSWHFGISLATPYDNDCGDAKHNALNINAFTHSFWFRVSQFLKPKQNWVDCAMQSWTKPNRDGSIGYTEHIRKEYGIQINSEAIFLRYGIQPGSWSRDDPENSDHTKVFWYPWQMTIMRHDLLFPDGSLRHRNTYPKRIGQYHRTWNDILSSTYGSKDTDERVETEGAKSVTLEHYNKTDGKLQKARIRLTGDEREWRPKWTRWLPLFKKIERVVDCTSDIELGTRAGGWKGGRMGWSCPWEEGESMEQAFRRWYKNWNGEE